MSVSMLTESPTTLAPRVVAARVSGMSDTSNQSTPTSLTVSDTPSTATEPFRATNGASCGSRLKRTTRQALPSVREMTRLVPSMWP